MKARALSGGRLAALALALLLPAPAVLAQSAAQAVLAAGREPSLRSRPIGSLSFIKGSLSLVRQGEAQAAPELGDPVYDGDLLRTDGSSSAVLAMDPSSGFSGSLSIAPGTALYLSRSLAQGQPKTSLGLMSGSLSAKVTKIAGTPTMGVDTGSSTFGVRGTQFEIALSLNDSLLALCTEGLVAILSQGGAQTALPAGQALERASGGSFAPVKAEAAALPDLRESWLQREGEAFKKAPLKALGVLEGRYTEHAKAILADTRKLALDPVFRKWVEEHRAGTLPDPLDPRVLREKKDIAPKLIALGKRLAVFELAWWRLQSMVEIVKDGEYSRREIRRGLLVSKFVADFERDRAELERAIFVYRRALGLYLERSPDSEDFVATLAAGGRE